MEKQDLNLLHQLRTHRHTGNPSTLPPPQSSLPPYQQCVPLGTFIPAHIGNKSGLEEKPTVNYGFWPSTLALPLQEAASKNGTRRMAKLLSEETHSHRGWGGGHTSAVNRRMLPISPSVTGLTTTAFGREITGVPQCGDRLSYGSHTCLLSRRGQASIPDLGQGCTSSWRFPARKDYQRGAGCNSPGLAQHTKQAGMRPAMSRAAEPSGRGGGGCGREKAALTWCSSRSQGGKLRCLFPPPRLCLGVSPGTKWHWLQLAWLGNGLLFRPFLPL